jgi:hypothetical protein
MTATTAADVDEVWKPTQTRARICMDSDTVLAIERLEEQLAAEQRLDERLNRVHDAVAPRVAEEILDLKEQAQASEVEFVFASVGRKVYTELIAAHPPTAEQEAEAGAKLLWNTDTFPPALLALAAVAPTGTTEAWWTRKYNTWGVGQIQRVWNACMAAQGGVVEVPKAAAASEVMTGFERSSS